MRMRIHRREEGKGVVAWRAVGGGVICRALGGDGWSGS